MPYTDKGVRRGFFSFLLLMLTSEIIVSCCGCCLTQALKKRNGRKARNLMRSFTFCTLMGADLADYWEQNCWWGLIWLIIGNCTADYLLTCSLFLSRHH